jgi:hypothetical protein
MQRPSLLIARRTEVRQHAGLSFSLSRFDVPPRPLARVHLLGSARRRPRRSGEKAPGPSFVTERREQNRSIARAYFGTARRLARLDSLRVVSFRQKTHVASDAVMHLHVRRRTSTWSLRCSCMWRRDMRKLATSVGRRGFQSSGCGGLADHGQDNAASAPRERVRMHGRCTALHVPPGKAWKRICETSMRVQFILPKRRRKVWLLSFLSSTMELVLSRITWCHSVVPFVL